MKGQKTNPHEQMKGHQPDTHHKSKKGLETDSLSSGASSKGLKVVRPSTYIGKYHKYLGHMQKAENVNRGHNLTPFGTFEGNPLVVDGPGFGSEVTASSSGGRHRLPPVLNGGVRNRRRGHRNRLPGQRFGFVR